MIFGRRKKYHHLEDEQLLNALVAEESMDVIGEIYRRYGHLVFGVCLKYLKNKQNAEDVTMQLFEKLPGKIASSNIRSFKSWLYMVSKNECLMFLRKKESVSLELTKELESEDTLDLKEAMEVKIELLEDAISSLNDLQKNCIELFYLQKKSYEDIKEELGIEIKKVKSAIQNGKRNLKINLEGRNEFKSVT